jgi:hypothetical protein
MAELGQIKIKSERKVQMVELDLDMDEKVIDSLAHAGFNLIKYDRQELAAYAFRKALEAYIKGDKECTLQIRNKSRSSKRSLRRSRSRKS